MTLFFSWNVNGLRAAYRKGFMDWFLRANPDVLCLQETKADFEQLPNELQTVKGYHTYYSSAQRKGYSGVALFSKNEPSNLTKGFGIKKYDVEGRVIQAEFDDYTLLNVYFPNGGASEERLRYKMDFYNDFLKHIDKLRAKGHSIIFCGDVNTAHREIDLARPKQNETNTGFLPIERAWIDDVLEHGYLDTFRLFESGGEHYSWWDYKTRARERNIGWRLDYFFASDDLNSKIKSAYILSDVLGSDHCPVALEMK